MADITLKFTESQNWDDFPENNNWEKEIKRLGKADKLKGLKPNEWHSLQVLHDTWCPQYCDMRANKINVRVCVCHPVIRDANGRALNFS